ncbi:MAG: bifunctional precorrin-2 dehydrogenase/sirohydrochlorin ferrochelatase, partial [Gemmatimonadota bacterium]|nr:bifunctional precorrin-2 dehydrogenase/sirohydrochlorin ferrochelatase [Gemmatimonadota bacterium]
RHERRVPVSGIPVMLQGEAIRALIVGGGRVAARKAKSLLDAGATVHVVAPKIGNEFTSLDAPGLTIARQAFSENDFDQVNVVIAATDDPGLNARVARLAKRTNRLVSVADAPAEGNFVSMATHRAGDLVVGVSAGGVPRAAARIRDAIAARFDARYARAIDVLRTRRRRLLDSGKRAEWDRATSELVDERFCARVESGALAAEADAWR